jgi:hypothetical protein
LEDPDEADDEDYDGADVLDYDCGVRDKRPEIVWLQSGIALQVFEEGILIGVIVWVFYTSAASIEHEDITHKIASPIAASSTSLSSSDCHFASYPYVSPSLVSA